MNTVMGSTSPTTPAASPTVDPVAIRRRPSVSSEPTPGPPAVMGEGGPPSGAAIGRRGWRRPLGGPSARGLPPGPTGNGLRRGGASEAHEPEEHQQHDDDDPE